MRLVQLSVPPDTQDSILSVLDEKGVDYVVTEEVSDREYVAVVYVPLPSPAVEDVLDSLQAQGIEEDAYTVVLEAEAVISRRFDELREAYEDESIETDRLSKQELRAEASSLTPTVSLYLVMTVLSAVVAAAGLLLDSPAVVVGSMVIAPLIGPALGASVGSVLDDRTLLHRSVALQLLGVVTAIAAAAVFAWLAKTANVVPPGLDLASVDEIDERLAPDLLSLVIALGAGVAGILSITTGVSVALVGVMIAAALIPPAATAGIALAFGQPSAAMGSTVLVFVNLLSVNLMGLLTLWYLNYRPGRWIELVPAQERVRRQVLALVIVVGIFTVFLGSITYASFLAATFEADASAEAERVLADETYDELELISLSVELDEEYPIQDPERVIVTVGAPPGETYPDLGTRLHERIDALSDEDVTVEVRYVEVVKGSQTTDRTAPRVF